MKFSAAVSSSLFLLSAASIAVEAAASSEENAKLRHLHSVESTQFYAWYDNDYNHPSRKSGKKDGEGSKKGEKGGKKGESCKDVDEDKDGGDDDYYYKPKPKPECALPTRFDQNVQPRIIFGSGNENGGFTIGRSDARTEGCGNIEVGLRGKIRFDYRPDSTTTCDPVPVVNSNGDGTYSFPSGGCDDPMVDSDGANPVWAFDWSINSDVGCDQWTTNDGYRCTPLDAYDYELRIDCDRTYGTDFTCDTKISGLTATFDPINVELADHALGTESTLQGGDGAPCGDGQGTWMCPPSTSSCNVAIDAAGCLLDRNPRQGMYLQGIRNLQVAQNTVQYPFLFPLDEDPINKDLPGIYTVQLVAFEKGTRNELAATEIQILVGDMNAADDGRSFFPTAVDDCFNVNLSTEFGGVFARKSECIAFVNGDFDGTKKKDKEKYYDHGYYWNDYSFFTGGNNTIGGNNTSEGDKEGKAP